MENQIEEMAKAIHINCHKGLTEDEAKMIAKWCYQEIDRKASDLAEEIFAEIDKMLDDVTIVMGALDSLRTFHKTIEKVTAIVEELKKKYTEGGK
jgi:hypothetical protein